MSGTNVVPVTSSKLAMYRRAASSRTSSGITGGGPSPDHFASCASQARFVAARDRLLAAADEPARAACRAELRQAVREETGATVHEVALIRRRTIPKTSSGKIQRRGCRELYLSRKLQELHRATSSA